jgi:hypothetical protein
MSARMPVNDQHRALETLTRESTTKDSDNTQLLRGANESCPEGSEPIIRIVDTLSFRLSYLSLLGNDGIARKRLLRLSTVILTPRTHQKFSSASYRDAPATATVVLEAAFNPVRAAPSSGALYPVRVLPLARFG